MPGSTKCPKCGKVCGAPEGFRDGKLRCPSCQVPFSVLPNGVSHDIRLSCPTCLHKMQFPDLFAGHAATCPQCRRRFLIPTHPKPEPVEVNPTALPTIEVPKVPDMGPVQFGQPSVPNGPDLGPICFPPVLSVTVASSSPIKPQRGESLDALPIEDLAAEEEVSPLTRCTACTRSIAKAAVVCPNCGAPNKWLHPEIVRFFQSISQLYFRPDMPRPFSGNDRRLHLGRKQSQLYLPSRIPGERQLAQCSFVDLQAGRPPSPSPDGSQSPDRNRVCLAPDQVRAHGASPRPSSAQHREWIGLPGRVWPDHAGAAAIVAEAFCWCRVRAGRFFGGRDAGDRVVSPASIGRLPFVPVEPSREHRHSLFVVPAIGTSDSHTIGSIG